MALEIQGLLHKILPEERGNSANGEWVKRNFVLETRENYPKKICFAAWGDKAAILGQLSEGAEIKVSFDPQSREYNGRWYTDLKAWKIDALQAGSNPSPNPQNPAEMGGDYMSREDVPPMGDDDLPF